MIMVRVTGGDIKQNYINKYTTENNITKLILGFGGI